MSQGLLTGGYESSGVTSGGGGGGPSGIRVYFSMVDTAGVYTAGVDLSGAGVVQVSKNGNPYVNRAGAAPTSIGGGDYYYELDDTEIDTPPTVIVKVVKNGFGEIHAEKDLGDPAQVSDVNSIATNVLNSILSAIGSSQISIEDHLDSSLSTAETTIVTAVDSARDTITTNTDAARADIKSKIDTAQAALTVLISRVLGMHGDNSLLDGGAGQPNIQYTNKVITTARLRVFADAAALALATPGALDGADNEVFRWSISGTVVNALGATLKRSRSL